MQQIIQAIQAGYAAFKRGDYAEARRFLEGIDHEKAVHLLALVEKDAGDLGKAADLMEKAASLNPNDPEIANSRARMARDTGQLDLAESEFRRTLDINPDFRQAKDGLARLLIDTERWSDALQVYQSLLQSAPSDVSARYGLGTALLGLGHAEEAESVFDRLVNDGSDQAQVRFMRARARLELGQVEAAVSDLEASHSAVPNDFSLRTLASTYWMTGDEAAFDALVSQSSVVPELAVTSAEILRQCGKPDKALETLGTAREIAMLPVESWSVAATAYIDLEQAVEAEAASRECLALDPGNRVIKGSLITSLLMQGKAKQAIPFIETMRQAEPDAQHWIAYEASALRLLGSKRYAELVDLERFVRPYQLPVPDGYDSIEAFNSAFLDALDKWHQYKKHPLDQSLRDGSQTPRDLTTIDDPVIKAFYRALDAPIRQYMADVGTGNDHPLTARNTGDYRINGAWSVRLRSGGWHVNHVHPEGWISSAYYVLVPEDTKTDDNRAGWIKFAEPPFTTNPPSPPEKWICPTAGTLVLFPSFLWHGTQPFHDGTARVTAPFDVVPV